MKLLFKAALRNRRHLLLTLFTFASLLALTVATQCEMCSIGLMANAGNLLQGKESANPLSQIFSHFLPRIDLASNLHWFIVLLIFVALFKAIALFTSRYLTQLLAIRVTRDLRQQYFEHIQSLPLSFYQEQNLGSLSARTVSDAGQIASSLNSCLTNYLQTPFQVIMTLSACFYLSWRLSMIIFLGLPLIIFPVLFVTRRVKSITRLLQKNQETFSSVLLDFLAGIQTVKIFAMEAFSLRKYKEHNDRMARLESKSAKYGLLTRPLLHLVATSCLAIVILFGIYGLKMTIGELLMFSGFLHMFYEPVKKFAEENNNIQRGVVAAERMFEVLELKPKIHDCEGAALLSDFHNEIEFDRVWFRYQEEWVLQDLSFSVKKGEVVALVGATGAGKSTLVQLLPRLYEVERGEIRIDGVPIQSFTQKSLRDRIAFVPQRPFLFFDTVGENIAFGRDFSQEEIEEAAKRAHAHEFVSLLQNGYDTQLAEMGKSLSGGEQQRIAIARALVKKAPILILDEATSSLDAISESYIKRALHELQGQVTQILIAHRLSTIEHADRIIFLEKGRKLAEGPLSTLLQICPPFRLMWETYTSTSITQMG
ncbi:MAG: ABC transporter ATP-binding protein [Verrucomicrobiota bacterium]|nr:ABC transporter ATP-binding protein [Verrucomicrobiota bacterium]